MTAVEVATPLDADVDLPAFPIRRQCPGVLPAAYEAQRSKGVGRVRLPTGQLAWLITGYDDARAVLSDPRFSADKMRPDFPKLSQKGLDKLKYFAPFIVNLDGPQHAGVRKSIMAEFSAGRAAALRPRVQEVVEAVVADVLAAPTRPVDLVPALSYAVAWKLQELLLGIPVSELERVRQHTEDLLLRTRTEDEEIAAAGRLHAHLKGVLEQKEQHLGDDLVSRQIRRHRAEKGHVDHFELASLVQLLAVGGHNSVATMISLGVLTLLTRPADLQVLRDRPDRMPRAVAELLRFYAVNDATPLRLALADVQVGDTLIRAGDGVAVPLLPPNRDPGLCPHPNDLDLVGDRPSKHLAFGHGPHRCVAYHLAPLELEVVFTTLFDAIPTLRLAVAESDVCFTYHSPQAFGPVALPVTW